MDRSIDLRSDTVTLPSREMRRAIGTAEVGDDVLGEDPSVRALEQATAQLLERDGAVFVPSGTMANQLAAMALTGSGDEVLAHEGAHIVAAEQGALAFLGRLQVRPYSGELGAPSVETIDAWVAGAGDVHVARPRLVCLENTTAVTGGRVVPRALHEAVVGRASAAGLAVHLDGSRLWNAAAATGSPVADLARGADTVSVCFSKGLGAPVGSAVAGGGEVVAHVRRRRKLLGGAMRQAGVLAAGALWALDHHRERLVDDHRRARLLASALAELPGVRVDLESVETNIVLAVVETAAAPRWQQELAHHGVQCLAVDKTRLRLVTHRDVTDEDVEHAISALAAVASQESNRKGRRASDGHR